MACGPPAHEFKLYIFRNGEISMNIEITQPEGYDLGAWQTIIKLDDEEKEIVKDRPLAFKIPRLNYRNILSDDGYRMAGFINDEVKLGGLFKDGIWCGHVYSNGIAEEKNPVSIASVKISLEEHIKQSIEFGYFFGAIAGNTNYFDHFKENISQIRLLNHLELNDVDQKETLNKLLFVNCITAMETYLSDAFINTVIKDKTFIRSLLENDPEFKKRKFVLSDIFSRFENLYSEVSDYLSKILYHNVSKIKPMYGSVLSINFPDDLSNIIQAIRFRHDIVHRNGKTKDGDIIKLTEQDIEILLERVEKFIEHIESQLANKI